MDEFPNPVIAALTFWGANYLDFVMNPFCSSERHPMAGNHAEPLFYFIFIT